jgi:predicted transcriptional regulator of viral defense system
MDWAKILKYEAKRSDVILAAEFAAKHAVSIANLRKALARQAARGFVERVTDGIYVNKFATDISPFDLVTVLRPKAYVSLESALHLWGISTQIPDTLTCVTTEKGREYRTSNLNITFRRISPKLFWGFSEKQTRYSRYKIALPEKALLDWIYLTLQDGHRPDLDDFDFKIVSKSKLIEFAAKYPSTVLNLLLRHLALGTFAA